MNMKRTWPVLLVIIASVLGSCNGDASQSVATSASGLPINDAGTLIPFGTYQAEIELTAEWVQTLTAPQTATAQAPTQFSADFLTDLTARRGDCPILSGFRIHVRQGFCIAAPIEWVAANVDGGMASTLNSTPGQSIALLPAWSTDSAQCYLLIYVSAEASARAHLELRFREYQIRADLVELTAVNLTSLGSLSLPGFTWKDQSGARGGVYASLLSTNKLLHISEGGTNCPLDQLLPVLETLRFN